MNIIKATNKFGTFAYSDWITNEKIDNYGIRTNGKSFGYIRVVSGYKIREAIKSIPGFRFIAQTKEWEKVCYSMEEIESDLGKLRETGIVADMIKELEKCL